MKRMSSRTMLGMGLAVAVAFVLGLTLGHNGLGTPAQAQTTVAPTKDKTGKQAEPSDYSKRVVAFIYGNMPIPREDLGEYLIARYGAEKLDLMVNKRIIELACKKEGIVVTDAEVNAALAEDLKGLGVNLKDFVGKVLKQYHKNLFEWKEDVIKPRLLLAKLCQKQVHPTEQDIKDAFEAYYGEKVDCRIIMWPKSEARQVINNIWAKIKGNEAEFERAATSQASKPLAATGGRISPIGHKTTGNEEMEKIAFMLKPGDLSEVFGTPEGLVVLKCIKRIPADETKKLEDVRKDLEKEIIAKKVQLEIPQVFQKLRKEADPKLLLKEQYVTQAELERGVQEELFDKKKPESPPPGPGLKEKRESSEIDTKLRKAFGEE